ncbi:MAG: response regulator [Candidatus Marinimicrobia bacterium]|nr:response regulator [Candidatus Neomarinimicrobiota bacterium]
MKPKIIIVDDDKLICELYSEYFAQNGFTVQSAFSAHEALKKIRETDPDIVLSDIIMPNEDGFSLYEKVQLFNPDLPFVFITGYDHDEIIASRLNETGRKWIAKPVMLEELMDLIKSELKQ